MFRQEAMPEIQLYVEARSRARELILWLQSFCQVRAGTTMFDLPQFRWEVLANHAKIIYAQIQKTEQAPSSKGGQELDSRAEQFHAELKTTFEANSPFWLAWLE